MQYLKVLVLDDDLACIELIKHLLVSIGIENITTAISFDDATKKINIEEFDLFLLDVQLSGLKNGFDLAKEITQRQDAIIFFLTSHFNSDTFEAAKRYQPYQFFEKFPSDLQLRQAIELALEQQKKKTRQRREFLFVKVGKIIKKIAVNDILWIEVEGRQSRIVTKNNSFLTSVPLVKLLPDLPNEKYVRIHKSFLINLEKVDSISFQQNTLSIAEKTLPIGRNFKQPLKKTVNAI